TGQGGNLGTGRDWKCGRKNRRNRAPELGDSSLKVQGAGARPSISAGARALQSRTPRKALSRLDYRWPSRKDVNCDLERAPTFVAASWPPLKSMSVGMPRMP